MTPVRDLKSVLLTDLRYSRVFKPKVAFVTVEDAKSLFGDDLKRKVKLRVPGRHTGSFHLPQLIPNFRHLIHNFGMLQCRHPSCDVEASQCISTQRMYLCGTHLEELRTKIAQVLNFIREPFSLNMADHEENDLAEYTSLIGLLEAVFYDSKKSPVILEAVLNVRNFLIITSTVLNPDAATSVPLVALILRLMFENEHEADGLLSALRKVIELILSAFGIIYSWICISSAPIAHRIECAFVVGWLGAVDACLEGQPWMGKVVFGIAFGIMYSWICISSAPIAHRIECAFVVGWLVTVVACLEGQPWMWKVVFGIASGTACVYFIRKSIAFLKNYSKKAIISRFETERKMVYEFHGDADGAFELGVHAHTHTHRI